MKIVIAATQKNVVTAMPGRKNTSKSPPKPADDNPWELSSTSAKTIARKMSGAAELALFPKHVFAWFNGPLGNKFHNAVKRICKPYKGLFDELDNRTLLPPFVLYICAQGPAVYDGTRLDFKAAKELRKQLNAYK